MQILDILRNTQGGAAVDNLARSFNIEPGQVDAVLEQVVPELSYRMERNTLSRGGIADLIEALGTDANSRYADDPSILGDPQVRDEGNQILGWIFRTKAKSRQVASRAAASSGISSTIIKAMLPYIASMLMGGLAKSSQGGLGDILKRLPGMLGGGSGRSRRKQSRQIVADNGPLSMPGSPQGGYTAPSGGAFEGSPLPLPDGNTISRGGNNPYGDIGDTLRRGGSGGSTLWGLARSLLGGLLGFQSKGVMGWFIRLIVMRFGGRILKFILGRFIGMR